MKNKQSELNSIIPPEIKNDELYKLIEILASEIAESQHILEIGSSSGGGSTEAFVKGISKNLSKPTLYCMEVSQVRFQNLTEAYQKYAFVKTYNVSSVPIDEFPSVKDVIDFYQSNETGLNKYDLSEIIRWLRQDIDYIKESSVPENGIQIIKNENDIEYFDLVLIDGSEFTGNSELNEVYGARIIILDDANSYKNYVAHNRLVNDPNYELVRKNFSLRNGYSIFKRKDTGYLSIELSIHFFTIVLNGKPFIDYHINVLKELPFKWYWHIVEGVADLKHDTAWSIDAGGLISEEFHIDGLSIDGTSEYLDKLAKLYPDNITVYRKPRGTFWDGKREMVETPLRNITEECLLW
jgi:hypothetical protein